MPSWEEWRQMTRFDWRIVDRNRRKLAEGRSPLVIDQKGRVWPADVRKPWADGAEES